jgi:hypothetical protein
MTTIKADKSPAPEAINRALDSREVRGSSVTTHVGHDTVEIDVSALKHLVATMKAKLSS